ncbi:MAG TPA: LuxR family transcriptional regulator, partial [Nocardioidaceae bacterium]|nr:LuxR family transcriptional regulator [Nocardioidaceae bacterium]
EPGIGKTAMLEEAATLVENMRVLRARGLESEQSVPFGGLLQLLRPVLALLDRIPRPQADALGAALLLEPRTGANPSRFAVGAATLSLLSRAAEDGPIAVLVDDAHVLDQPSAEALVFAARRLLTDAVAIIATVRPSEPGTSPWTALPSFDLRGLTLSAARELLAKTATGQSTAHQLTGEQLAGLHQATAGNPLALLELGEQLDRIATLPPGSPFVVSTELTRRFIGQVADLTAGARSTLLVAAADSHSLAVIHQACLRLGLPGARLTEAVDAGLVTVSGDRLEFRHPLVRSAVYGSADAGTRRTVHRALAAVLPEDESDRLAWHISEGAVTPDEPAAATLDSVARRASARGAFAIAARAHERAAELTIPSQLLAQRLASAGRAAWLAGAGEHAVLLLARALDNASTPQLRTTIQELRGAVETRSGRLDEARSTLSQAAAEAEAIDPDMAVRLLSDAIHVSFYLAEPATALNAAETIESLLGVTVDPRSRFHGTMACGMARILGGAGEAGVEQLRRAVALTPDADTFEEDQLHLPHQLLGPLWLREAGASRKLLDGAIDRLRDQTALGVLPYLLMHIARDDATTDRWDDAEAGYLEAIRLATETRHSTDQAASMAGLGWLWARRGRVQEFREMVPAALELCRTTQVHIGTAWLMFAQGDLEAGLENPAAAARHYEALEARLRDAGLSDPDLSPAPELTEAYLHLGRTEDAHRVAAGFEAKAVAKGQPWALARAERSLGLCAPDASGEAHFRSALELHRQTPDSYETARTELALGARLRRGRRRVDARPHLRSALATFQDLGAAPWAHKAVQELDATGETVHHRAVDALDQLTPQERQISRLLAQGRTTRETAAALFISPKTVEYHLRHVYVKLGVRSREALAEAFAR